MPLNPSPAAPSSLRRLLFASLRRILPARLTAMASAPTAVSTVAAKPTEKQPIQAARNMDPKEKTETTGTGGPLPPRLDCIKCFDALWFCYSPFHQMQSYYRYGEFDNCFGKWGDLVDCLTLKTKRVAEVEEILAVRERAKPHIWTYRTVDEASEHWWRMYKHLVAPPPPPPQPAGTAAPPPESGGVS